VLLLLLIQQAAFVNYNSFIGTLVTEEDLTQRFVGELRALLPVPEEVTAEDFGATKNVLEQMLHAVLQAPEDQDLQLRSIRAYLTEPDLRGHFSADPVMARSHLSNFVYRDDEDRRLVRQLTDPTKFVISPIAERNTKAFRKAWAILANLMQHLPEFMNFRVPVVVVPPPDAPVRLPRNNQEYLQTLETLIRHLPGLLGANQQSLRTFYDVLNQFFETHPPAILVELQANVQRTMNVLGMYPEPNDIDQLLATVRY